MTTPHSLSSLDVELHNLRKIAAQPMEQATSLSPPLYWREDVADLEKGHIFRRDWVCAGLAADLPKAGDYLSYSVAGEPIFCIRDRAGSIRTFSNVCRHRMMRLVDGKGRAERITCPYHAWAYDLSGKLVGAGHMKDSMRFDRTKICLPEGSVLISVYLSRIMRVSD